MPNSSKSINWPSFITIISAVILIGTELAGAAWAFGWAMASFFRMGPVFEVIIQCLFGLIAAYGLFAFLRQAVKVEPIFRRN